MRCVDRKGLRGFYENEYLSKWGLYPEHADEKVSIAIATYKRAGDLNECLHSLLKQSKVPYEILICDDGNDDNTIKVIEEFEPKFKSLGCNFIYFSNKTRLGLPKSRNLLVSRATGDVIAFLDDDVVCSENWLNALITSYCDPSIDGVGGPAIAVNKSSVPKFRIVNGEKNLNTINKYGEHVGYFGCWIPPKPVETDLLMGANMSFRKETIAQVGGFDSGYLGNANLEDTDFVVRVRQKGFKLLYHPEALVYHKLSSSGGCRLADKERWFWYGFNSMRFIRKNFPHPRYIIFIRLFWRINKLPLPMPLIIIAAIIKDRDISRLWQIKGYLAGLLKEPQ